MNHIFTKVLLLSFSILLLFFSVPALPVYGQSLTDDILGQVDSAAGSEGADLGTPTDPRQAIAEIIRYTLSLIGMLCIVLIVTAGYWRLTAHGEDSKIEKSNKTIQGAVIGLIIILLSYAITLFVVPRIQNRVQNTPVYEEQ